MISDKYKFKRIYNKYGNKKSKGLDGYNYSSKLEAAIGNLLFAREQAGEIAILQRQGQVELLPKPFRVIYKPDFICQDLITQEEFIAEPKGMETDVWKIKLAIYYFLETRPIHIYYKQNVAPRVIRPLGLRSKLNEFLRELK